MCFWCQGPLGSPCCRDLRWGPQVLLLQHNLPSCYHPAYLPPNGLGLRLTTREVVKAGTLTPITMVTPLSPTQGHLWILTSSRVDGLWWLRFSTENLWKPYRPSLQSENVYLVSQWEWIMKIRTPMGGPSRTGGIPVQWDSTWGTTT